MNTKAVLPGPTVYHWSTKQWPQWINLATCRVIFSETFSS